MKSFEVKTREFLHPNLWVSDISDHCICLFAEETERLKHWREPALNSNS